MSEHFFNLLYIILNLALSGARHHGNSSIVSRKTDFHFKKWTSLSIFDGNETSINKHPYLVVVEVDKTPLCTGAIVSDSWVLTTADCAQEDPEKMKILMYRKFNKVRTVQNVTFHPNYPSDVYDYDYACLQIKGTFQFSKGVRPIMIPRTAPGSGDSMVVAGWNTNYLSNLSVVESERKVVEGEMKWLSRKSCNTTLSSMGVSWTKRMACAYNRNKTTLCSGGWGVPLVKDGVMYGQFVGADAEGFCSSKASPVILSNLAPVAPWVRAVTGATRG